MEDQPNTRIDHPEQLCEAIVGIVDELEDEDIIEGDQASQLRSQIYRAVDIAEE